VSDRLLRLKDRSKFDHGINKTSLSPQLIHDYKTMLVLDEVEKGCPLALALKQNECESFHSDKLTYTQIRADILMVFFKSLDKLVLSFKGLSLVNQEIIKTGNNAYVYNHDFCQQWFNNVDKKENLPRKQLFGSFYFFGDKNYLLHIEVATMNLHIGFVKYHKVEDNCQVLKMELSDYESITEQYGACFDKGMKFAERSWGLKWYSHDYGNFIDLANVTTYSTMVDLLHSELSQKNLIPLLELLRKTNKFKK
jgi:hypothetical protein